MHHLGRKLFHCFGGMALLSCYGILGRERALVTYAVLGIAVLAFDLARLRLPAINRAIVRLFHGVIRENEAQKLSGIAPYVAGTGLSLYLFSVPVAAAAVCFLAFGDVAATTVGERWGRTKIGTKSLEGTSAFVAAALVAGVLLRFIMPAPPATVLIAGGLAAAGVELLPLPVNDNLTIPLVAGAVMELALRALG